jgi:hypothetical protein
MQPPKIKIARNKVFMFTDGKSHISSSPISHTVNNSSPPTVTSGCGLESVSFYSQLDFCCSSELCFSVVLIRFRKEGVNYY